MNVSDQTYSLSRGKSKLSSDQGSWLSAVFARVRDIVVRAAKHRAVSNEMQELDRFSDRELWDVGLSRSDLMAIEKGTYRRD